LKGDLEFRGTFAFSQSYDAPNPILQIADLGTVGLPLGIRDVAAIKSWCTQTPVEHSEHPVAGAENTRDTWEMDASQVIIRNPVWNKWLLGVAQDVCKALGVNTKASQPKAELCKLLLQGSGFQ
jgi:hypothetical protein